MTYSDTTVIIPTLNEEKSIGELLGFISKYKGIKIIVADDNSEDRTRQIAKRKKAKVLDRSKEPVKGLTISVMDAVMACKTKYFVVIDGDLQHPPEKIAEIVGRLRHGNELIIGTRRKVLSEWPLNRRLMSSFATQLARLRLMKLIRDPLAGFFGADTAVFREVLKKKGRLFEKQGYKVLFDFLKYAPKDLKTGIVLYDFGTRKGGESKINSKHMRIFFRSLFK